MEQLTLQQLFGNSASQDSPQLIISKADSQDTHPDQNNTVEESTLSETLIHTSSDIDPDDY